MLTEHIIALLVAERDKVNRAIEALQGPIKRRGRPPKNPLLAGLAPATTPAKGKSGRSAAARKAQSQRMKAYWAAKRKNRTR
jgi:hypothetical protein